MAHITGGGITDNLPRVLPPGIEAVIRARIVGRSARSSSGSSARGRVPREDMLRTFNMGVGLILVVAAADVDRVLSELTAAGERGARVIGSVAATSAEPRVRYES